MYLKMFISLKKYLKISINKHFPLIKALAKMQRKKRILYTLITAT